MEESYAAYGARRGANWTGTPTQSEWNQIATTTRRGYTSHMAGRLPIMVTCRASSDHFLLGDGRFRGWL